MRIFLSHSSRDKPLLREVMQYIPRHVRTWLDDNDLRIGEDLHVSIRKAINIETDFVIIFISPESVRSKWVRLELEWALKREREIGRVFILPVVIDEQSWRELPESIQNKRYLSCTDFSEHGVKKFADRLCDELFAWTTRLADFNESMNPELLEEDLRNRRRLVKSIARNVSDNQDECNQDECLTNERLSFIISSLDFQHKLQLLILYEIMRGKFRDYFKNVDWEHGQLLDVELRLSTGEKWTRTFDFGSKSFEILRNEYGLGDRDFLVRDVFLDGIYRLDDKDRDSLFSNVQIMSIEHRTLGT